MKREITIKYQNWQQKCLNYAFNYDLYHEKTTPAINKEIYKNREVSNKEKFFGFQKTERINRYALSEIFNEE